MEENWLSHEEEKLDEMRSVWRWARNLRKLRHDPAGKRENGLLEQCAEGQKLPAIQNGNFLLPSKSVEKIAESFESSVKEKHSGEGVNPARYDLPFQVQKHGAFPLSALLKYICDNAECVTGENSVGLFVMLIDTALYWTYRVVSKLACGRLLFQLNACIMLDAMILKPDGVAGNSASANANEMVELLRTVVKKTQNQIESLDKDVIWAIAMLSYKTQRYGRARYYFESYLNSPKSLTSSDDEKRTPLLDDEKRGNAYIYIGYCFEKRMKRQNHFTLAIDRFEDLRTKLTQEGEDVRKQVVQNLRELSEDKNPSADIVSALKSLEENLMSADEFKRRFDSLMPALEKKRAKNVQARMENFRAQQKKLEKLDEYLVEIHHGLGHFYNERAVFGDSKDTKKNPPKDLVTARAQMWWAMQKRPADFASCYGSLFHEYEDYDSALTIFEDAEHDENLTKDPELAHELQFYIAQTETLMNKNADEKFKSFEEYCKEVFNFDGIIHARIFQARAYLRTIPFSAKRPSRKKTKDEILSHYERLTEYSLSNYASESIRNEYEKTRFMLSVYRSFYWDEDFSWRMADVQYGLENFMKHMPEDMDSLNFEDSEEKREDSNLYVATIPYDFVSDRHFKEDLPMRKMQIWCIAENPFPQELFRAEGGLVENVTPVNDLDKAYLSMVRSGHTAYVAVIPPKTTSEQEKRENDRETQKGAAPQFKPLKREIHALKNYFRKAHKNLRFLLPPVGGNEHNWLKDELSRERTIASIDVKNNLEALQYAFCFQALSILRSELLQPMPLFTLVPTHLSASFAFQSGQSLELLPEDLLKADGTSPAMLHFRLREVYQQAMVAPNRNAFEQRSGAGNPGNGHGMLPCASKALMTVCCPNPINEDANNYLSYQADFNALRSDGIRFARGVPSKIDPAGVYYIKALPDYASLYFKLLDALEQCESCADTACEAYGTDECNLYYTESSGRRQESARLSNRKTDITQTCLDLLGTIIVEPDIQRGYKCVLRQSVQDSSQAIFIMLMRDNADGAEVEGEQNRREAEPQSEKTTVGISYSWEETPEYNKEVAEFKAELERKLGDGYQVILDRELNKRFHNWDTTTTYLLDNSNKIIVLLSEGYKKKADSTEGKKHGVYIESHAIAHYFDNGAKEDIIFATLAPKSHVEYKDLMPIHFLTEDINYLTEENPMAGNGMEALLARIRGEA